MPESQSGLSSVRRDWVDARPFGISPLSKQHLTNLDGVRGLAILLVLLVHLDVMKPQTPFEQSVHNALASGWIGVDLFFVLSGMLITGILLDNKGHRNYYLNFYARRALRILPLYILILIFSLYILPAIPHPKADRFNQVQGDELWYWFFLQNYRMAMFPEPRHGIMDVTWSLAIEEQFYLIWPFIVSLLNQKRLAFLAVSLMILSLSLRIAMLESDAMPWSVYVLTPTRLDGLSAGALIAILLRSYPRSRLEPIAKILLAVGLISCAILWNMTGGLIWNDFAVQSIGSNCVTILFGATVLWATLLGGQTSIWNKLFSSRFLTHLGIISYSLYLTHLPIRAAIRDIVIRPDAFPQWWGGTLMAQLIFYVVAGTVCICVAHLIFVFIERPILRLKTMIRAQPIERPSAT